MDTRNDHWDFYSCEIEGKPHSMMVNLSLIDVAPISSLTLFQCLEVTLRYPNPKHGMTTKQEYEALKEMDELVDRSETKDLKFVARQTGDSKRKFYFYGSSKTGLTSLFDSIGSVFPAYEKTTFSFEDADWLTYFENLYPNAIGMNEITNRSVFDRLEASGDDLATPRSIDHSVLFVNRERAKDFEKIVVEKGFAVTVSTKGFLTKTFDLLVQRTDSPSSLDPITLELEQLAENLGGVYDGWGCIAIKSGDLAE